MTPDPDPVLIFIRKLGRLFFRVVAGIHEIGLEGEKKLNPEKQTPQENRRYRNYANKY